jgi:hypothetical protein
MEMTNLRLMQHVVNGMRLQDQKDAGWSIYNNTDSTPERRASGLLMVMEAQYEDNFEGESKAPPLATYVAHWLGANRSRHDRAVVDFLIARYPTPPRLRIKPGSKYWD